MIWLQKVLCFKENPAQARQTTILNTNQQPILQLTVAQGTRKATDMIMS